jgi:hypothetical protein
VVTGDEELAAQTLEASENGTRTMAIISKSVLFSRLHPLVEKF